MQEHILIVDDEKGILTALTGVLEDEGYTVSTAGTGSDALKKIYNDTPSVVLLDIWLPDIDGLDVLKEIKAAHKDIPVIVMSGHGTIETAVKATKLGAYDYIEKPLSMDRVNLLVSHAVKQQHLELENVQLRKSVEKSEDIIGESIPMRQLKEQLRIVGASNSRVLITGENGTGKELVARSIHRESHRADKLFVAVNCAAIPETLIESELFGHEKGAFTGATAVQRGKFELADGGTLFLDEVGDMSLNTQAKVLRVLQEQEFQRVGGNKNLKVDVRLISATNKKLPEEIKKGTFREDLYYRINVITLNVPPLKERRDDIPLLAQYFLKDIIREQGLLQKVLTEETAQLLKEYDWPGNVRELRNLMERAAIMVQRDRILPEDLAIIAGHGRQSTSQFINERFESLREARAHFERLYITERLKENSWNITRTAEDLKIERTNLHRKMKMLGIEERRENCQN
ncbi:MAG: sigma-54 dependent transcriptional regulator [Nitrospira sp.]|nr:sigma-54 dependent transcriptional regulator [Nitrospira sp.]